MSRSITLFNSRSLALALLALGAGTLSGCGDDPEADQAVAAQAAADRAEAAAERAEKAASAVSRANSEEVPVDNGSSSDQSSMDAQGGPPPSNDAGNHPIAQ